MSTPASGGNQQITYALILEAKDMVTTLSNAQKSGMDLDTTIKTLTTDVEVLSKKWGADWQYVLSIVKAMNAELAKKGEGLVPSFKEDAESIKGAAAASSAALGQVGARLENASVGFGKLLNMTNMLRLALGVIESMFIFQLMQAVTQFFSTAIKYANDYYQSILNITVAQDAMARQGVATTSQELLDMATRLEEKFKIFSEKDMVGAVSQAALLTAEYKLSSEQLERIVQMAGILAATHGGEPSKYIDDLIRSAMGASSRTGVQYGIRLSAEQIKAEAVRMGIADENTELNEQQKIVAGLSLEWERLGGQMEKVEQVQNSVTGGGQELASAWEDFLKNTGAAFSPVLLLLEKSITSILKFVADLTPVWNVFNGVLIYTVKYMMAIAIDMHIINELLHGNVAAAGEWAEKMLHVGEAAERFIQSMQQTGGIDITQNTPVRPGGGAETPAVQLDYSDFDDALNAYQDYYNGVEKANQAHADRMWEMEQRYNLNVQHEIENTQLKIAQALEDFQLKMEQEEERHQQKMRDLQARYLLDLEDALRKRDAEAVLRLIRKYNMEKESAEQNHAIQMNQDKEQMELRIKQMQEQSALRLQQMQDDYNLQQQMEERRYAESLAALQQALDDKLQEIAVKLGEEYGLDEEGVNAIYELFKEYYGTNGLLATEHADAFIAMKNLSETIVAQMEAIIAQHVANVAAAAAQLAAIGAGMVGTPMGAIGTYRGYGAGVPVEQPFTYTPSPGTSVTPGMSALQHQAAGGAMVANSPMTATFGEAGPELAMFLPLNASGNAMGNLGRMLGMGERQPLSGLAVIRVEVSDDLQARIVDSALTQAAVTIESVTRSRR